MEWKKKLAEWKAAGTEPPESLKEGGFTAGYKPPAAYFNWLFNTTYEALKEIRGNIKKDEWDGKVDSKGGDAADTKVSDFTPSSTPYPIPEAGETIKIIIGKLVKFCNDVKSGCCKVADIVNNCTSAATDKPLAAAVGKVLWDKIVDAVAALGTHKSSADHDGRYYTETEMDTKLGGKSSTGHTHDDRYYTESEINTKLDGKSNTNHGHSGMLVTGDVVDNCTSTATNKPLSAKQGKTLWDKITDAVSALATHKSSGDHDGRYYTESEINTKLGGKSDTSHNHDSSYVKKHTVAEVSGIQVGKKETNGYGWIDIYYKGVHEFSIYVENSGTGLIIKPALPLSTRHQYVNVLCQLQQKGNLVVDSGRIVDNCTSDVTYNVLSANQGRILMNKYNQLNSDITPVLKTGLTAANSNVVLADSSFITIGKLCILSFEANVKATFAGNGALLKLPSGTKPHGTYHFVLDFANTIKHAWLIDNDGTIYIQNGAEKTGNIRGSITFLLR